MAKHMNMLIKGQIISFYKCGKTVRKISSELKISIGTVCNTIQKYKKKLSQLRKPGSGRKTIMSTKQEKSLIQMAESDKNFNAVKAAKRIKESLNIDITAQTIRNILKRNKYFAYSPLKKPILTEKHKRARFDICKYWNMKPETFWNYIIFSDESKFNLFNSDGRTFVWRTRGKGLEEKNIEKTKKFSGGSIMVWGCFSYNGFSDLVIVEGIMDRYSYVSMINTYLPRYVERFKLNDFIFQQDNDPKHKSNYAI